MKKNVKVCLVTDWLTNLGGGEKVLEAISNIFPNTPIYTTVCNKKNIGNLAQKEIHTSFLQHIPVLNKKHQFLLPLLPKAIESLDVSKYDLVLSFSSSIAKSIKTHNKQTHICYIHSPMRYAWEPDFDPRFEKVPLIVKPLVKLMLKKLKKWDKKTSQRPDLYIANSKTTQARVKKYYNLETKVLFPPVETSKFDPTQKKEDFYLAAGRMVAYKKFDLIVQAFTKLPNKKLIIIGDGPEFKKVKDLAKNSTNIQFLGRVNNKELKQYFAKAKAFLLPQKEDAGIVQLEAFASGAPVIAYKEGGILDVLQKNINGIFFEKQTPEDLMKAIEEFEKKSWDAKKIRKTAQAYDTKEFQKNYLSIVEGVLAQHPHI